MIQDIRRDWLEHQFERLPPHAIEAERCVLSALMLCGDDRATFAKTRSGLTREAFYQADHQIIFDVVIGLFDAGKPIDTVIVREELKRRGMLEDVGGVAHLAQLLDALPSAAHGPHYASIVIEKYRLRCLIAAANGLLTAAHAPASEDRSSDLAMKFAGELATIGASGQAHIISSMRDMVSAYIDSRTDPSAGGRQLPTGLTDLDDVIGGLRKGQYTIVGGRPSMGKSQLIKQLLTNLAERGIPCGLIAVEEDKGKITENLLSRFSGVDNWRLAEDRAQREDWVAVTSAVPRLEGLPIYVVDTAFSLTDVVACAHQLVHRHKCEVIIVDHLHLIDGQLPSANRNQEVSAISRALKMMFRQLGVAGVVTAQLNRGGDAAASASRKPVLKDLRDSGSLEQDGDLILLLHREDYYHYADEGYRATDQLELVVAKNKSGRMAVVNLFFDGTHQRVIDWDQRPSAVVDIFG